MDGSVRKVRAGWRLLSLSGEIFGASGQISAPSSNGERPDVRGCCWGRPDAVDTAVRARRMGCIWAVRFKTDFAGRAIIYNVYIVERE